MRALVLGAGGQLGADLVALLADRSPGSVGARYDAVQPLTRAELDVTDGPRVRTVVRDQAAAAGAGELVVLNAAGWTDVDGAEAAEEAAYAVNAGAVAHLALACAETGARLVHVSTDYVFPGDRGPDGPPYDIEDCPAPRSAYGRTKRAGEEAVLELCPTGYVVRTAWVYGAVGRNFVKTMARLALAADGTEPVRVVDDQIGSPTWSRDLAAGLLALALDAAPGLYHATGGGQTTWHGLARAVFSEVGGDPGRVQPCATDAFPRPALRPAYSVLSDRAWRATGLAPLPPWRESLAAAVASAPTAYRP